MPDYTPEEEAAILAKFVAQGGSTFAFESLEDLFTSPRGFGVTTATPLQRALCRIIQGVPVGPLMDERVVQKALGVMALEQDGPPAEIDILAAVRCGKSMLIAAAALWASQHCDLTHLSKSEIPRYSIVSLERDNAAVTFGHLLGVLQEPDLAHLRVSDDDIAAGKWNELIKESSVGFTANVFVWHPSGRPVEVRVTAGKRAGGGLVSRWCLGLCLDEAPRMCGQDEAVINYDEARKAVRTRLVPGAQIFSIGSPWRAMGPMYERWLKFFGVPTTKRVVAKANGPNMNPYWWTPQRCAEIRDEDPDAYKTDVLAEFLEPLQALIPPIVVNEAMRAHPEHHEYEVGHDYTAKMDPATRGNAWTFAIGDRVGVVKRVVYNCEWQGTSLDPLKSKAVLREIGKKLREYGLDHCRSDQWSSDTIAEIADDLIDEEGEDIRFDVIREDWTQGDKRTAYVNFRDAISNSQVELGPDPQVAADLRLIQKRTTADGFTIVLPKTGDGRHCDYAPVVVGLLTPWIDEDYELPPDKGSDEYDQWLEEKMEQDELDEFEAELEDEWEAEEMYYG